MQALIQNNTITTYPYSFSQLKQDNLQTSFPANPSMELLESYGVYEVAQAEQPTHDPATHRIQEGTPEQLDGVWTQVWAVTALTAEEVQQRNDSQSASVRAERGNLLAVCDWTQVADAPVDKAAWATYRQALRDVPSQAGFPWTVNWPDAP